MGGNFGSIVSPADFESFARACTHLVDISTRRNPFEKQWEIIDKVRLSENSELSINFVYDIKDNYNKEVENIQQTLYNMFVDNSLFAQISYNMKHVMIMNMKTYT